MRSPQSKIWAAVDMAKSSSQGHHKHRSPLYSDFNQMTSPQEFDDDDISSSDLGSDSDSDNSLTNAIHEMKLRRNKQRKLYIQVILDEGSLNMRAPIAPRCRPSSASMSSNRNQQNNNNNNTSSPRHYNKEILSACLPGHFPSTDQPYEFQLDVSNELTWKRLANIAALRYGSSSSCSGKSGKRYQGDFIPINVSTVGPGQQDDFHHPNHTVLSGEYGMKDQIYNDDGDELTPLSSANRICNLDNIDQYYIQNTPNHHHQSSNKDNEGDLNIKQEGLHVPPNSNSTPKKSALKNKTIPTAKEAILNMNNINSDINSELLGNLHRHQNGNNIQNIRSAAEQSNDGSSIRSSQMEWRQSAKDVQSYLEKQGNKTNEIRKSIQGDSQLNFEKSDLEYQNNLKKKHNNRQKEVNEEEEEGNVITPEGKKKTLTFQSINNNSTSTQDNIRRNSGLTVKTTPSPKNQNKKNQNKDKSRMIKKKKKKKVDIWVTIALGVNLNNDQVLLPRWYSIAFFVSKGQSIRKQRALELELACQAELRAHRDRPYSDTTVNLYEVRSVLDRYLSDSIIPKAAVDSLVDAATWMIPVPSERLEAWRILSDYFPPLAQLFMENSTVKKGSFYLAFEQFNDIMEEAFGVREEQGWNEMILLLYRRSNILMRSHAADVVGVNAPALHQAGGIFLFGHHKHQHTGFSSHCSRKLNEAISNSKKFPHLVENNIVTGGAGGGGGGGGDTSSTGDGNNMNSKATKAQIVDGEEIDEFGNMTKRTVNKLKQTQSLLDGYLHKHRHRHKHDIYDENLENIAICPLHFSKQHKNNDDGDGAGMNSDDIIVNNDDEDMLMPEHRRHVNHPSSYHHHPDHPHYEFHKQIHNKKPNSNQSHLFQSNNLLVDKIDKSNHLSQEEISKRNDISRVVQRRLFDDRPLRNMKSIKHTKRNNKNDDDDDNDNDDENESRKGKRGIVFEAEEDDNNEGDGDKDDGGMMEFPEFLWAIWNLASVWGKPAGGKGDQFRPSADNDDGDTVSSHTTQTVHSFNSFQQNPKLEIPTNIFTKSNSKKFGFSSVYQPSPKSNGKINKESMSIVKPCQFDVLDSRGNTERYNQLALPLRNVVLDHLLPIVHVKLLDPITEFTLHMETILRLIQSKLDALRRVFEHYTVMDSEIAARKAKIAETINESRMSFVKEMEKTEKKKTKKQLAEELALAEAQAAKQKFEDETMSLAEFTMLCKNAKLISERKATILFNVSTNGFPALCNMENLDFIPLPNEGYLEKYYHSAMKSPTHYNTFNLNNQPKGSPFVKKMSSMFSPLDTPQSIMGSNSSFYSNDPFDIAIDQSQDKTEKNLDLADFLEALCRIAIWEGHDVDPTTPVEQRVEKCILKVCALDGVKRSAADASITRSKMLAKRRSENRRNTNVGGTPNSEYSGGGGYNTPNSQQYGNNTPGGQSTGRNSSSNHRPSVGGNLHHRRQSSVNRGFGSQNSRDINFGTPGGGGGDKHQYSNNHGNGRGVGGHNGKQGEKGTSSWNDVVSAATSANNNSSNKGNINGVGKVLGALRGANGFKNLVNNSREAKGLDPLDTKKSRHRTFYFE